MNLKACVTFSECLQYFSQPTQIYLDQLRIKRKPNMQKSNNTYDAVFYHRNTVYVSGWPQTEIVTPVDIFHAFKKFGFIDRIRLFEGEALVMFDKFESAEKALQSPITINGTERPHNFFVNSGIIAQAAY